MRNDIIEGIRSSKIITIVRGVDEAHCIKLAEALLNGGIRYMELPFDQSKPSTWDDTASIISRLNDIFNGDMVFGAGTVLTKDQVDYASSAGGKFIVAPNFNADIISYAREKNLVTVPGAMTPTEIQAAYEAGADFVKVYPAGEMGLAYFKSISVPLNHIPLVPTGSITLDNAKAFMTAGASALAIGGALADKAAINSNNFAKITETAKRFCSEVSV